MQAKTIKIIKVSLEGRKKLMEKYQCTNTTIYNALGYRTNGETPEAIRRDALNEYGGMESEKVVFF
nr:MAG TPA: hypothetical protein [Bacteriophage sp.]